MYCRPNIVSHYHQVPHTQVFVVFLQDDEIDFIYYPGFLTQLVYKLPNLKFNDICGKEKEED